MSHALLDQIKQADETRLQREYAQAGMDTSWAKPGRYAVTVGPDWECPDCGAPQARRCRPWCPNNE